MQGDFGIAALNRFPLLQITQSDKHVVSRIELKNSCHSMKNLNSRTSLRLRNRCLERKELLRGYQGKPAYRAACEIGAFEKNGSGRHSQEQREIEGETVTNRRQWLREL